MKRHYLFILSLVIALFSMPIGNVRAAQSLPYTYGFEDYDLSADGWTKYFGTSLTSNNNECAIVGAAKKTGSYGFRFSSYNTRGANAQYLISPELDGANGITVTFQYAASSTSGTEVFKVGYSTASSDVTDFTFGDEISTKSTSFASYENTFPIGTKYIAVYYYANYQYRIYVDDFSFVSAGLSNTCPAPSALTKDAVSATSATFSWTAGGDEASWQWACLPAATAVDWEDDTKVHSVTSATATVDGLDANTNYKFYVRAYCDADDQSSDVSLAFTTPCAAIASLPSCGFEDDTDGALPDCWSKISTVAYPCVYNYDYYAHNSNKSLYFYQAAPQYAILPVFSQDVKNLTATFWYRNYSYSESLQVGYMSDPEDASTFVAVETLPYITSYNSEATEVSFGSAPAGIRYIAFKYTCSSNWGKSFIDDISVSVASSCTKPTSPLAESASATSATVSWTAGGSETRWNLQYRVGSGAWTAVNGVTTNPYVLTGLSANTTYEIQVQADCGGEQSAWSASASVTTPCEAVTGTGWSENFEDETRTGSGNIPDCWKNIGGNYPYTYNSSYYAHESNKCLYFYGGTSSSVQIAVLPAFTEDLNTLSVSLWYNHYYSSYLTSSYPQLQIGYITNLTDASTFTAVQTLDRYATYTHVEDVAITGAPAGAYIALRWGGGSYSGYLMVDDIEIKKAPTCFKPASVTVDATTYNSVSFEWTASGHGETEWQYAVVAAGATPSSWTNTTTRSAMVSGLTTNTTYQICVRSYCGTDDQSDFIRSASFTPTCQSPSGVSVSALTSNSASVSWTANNGESTWNMQYKNGSGAWTTINSITANPYLLSGLEANSSYTVQVACAEGCNSGYSTATTFKTKCNPVSELPYENNFEGETTSAIPSCWDRMESGSYPQVTSGSASYGGSGKCLAFYGSGTQTAVLPGFETEVNKLTITFYYKHSYSDLQIGYIDVGGTFVPKATLPTRSAYNTTPYEVDMTEWSDAAAYIALRMTNTTSSYASAYVDNVVVKKTPTCFKPASLGEAASITSEGATFTWTASGKGETQYQYVCVPTGDTPDWSEATKVSTLTATVAGLDANTGYDFYVRSYCAADDQSESLMKSFTTLCVTASVPFDYGFEDLASSGTPACWNLHPASGYSAYASASNVHTGSKSLLVSAGKTDASRSVVVLPGMNAALNTLAVSFYYRGTANATIEVGYVTNASDKATFVPVGGALTATTSYKQAIVPLTSLGAVEGNIAMRFKGATGDADFTIDDIRVARTVTISDNADNASQLASMIAAGETSDLLITRSLLMNGDYNPLCLPFSISAAQLADDACPLNDFKLKVFDYIRIENDELLLYIAGASSIEAGVPYFVSYQGTPAEATTQLLFRDVKVTTDTPGAKTCDNVTYQGTFSPTILADQSAHSDQPERLFLGAGNTIYWPNSEVSLKGFRAYFTIDYNGAAAPVRRVRLATEQAEVATDVKNSESNKAQSVKVVRNGQLLIIRNGEEYTILGQHVR